MKGKHNHTVTLPRVELEELEQKAEANDKTLIDRFQRMRGDLVGGDHLMLHLEELDVSKAETILINDQTFVNVSVLNNPRARLPLSWLATLSR